MTIKPTRAVEAIWRIVDRVDPRWRQNVLTFSQHRYVGETIAPVTADVKQMMKCMDCQDFDECLANTTNCRKEQNE